MPPGWYPDNANQALVRFWDGRQWTHQTALARPPAPGFQQWPTPTAQPPARRRRGWPAVLLVVGALVVFGALLPDEDQPIDAGGQGSAQETESAPVETESEEADPTDEPTVEADVEEVVEEEPAPITVPALRAQSIKEARAALRASGLKAEIVRQPSWHPAGQVLKQGMKAGAVMAAGTVVTLVVAAPMPKVPGVIGQGPVVSQDALQRAGFTVRVVRKVVTSGVGNVVLSQSPGGGQMAEPGSLVELVISNLVAPLAPVSNCTAGYDPCLAPASDYDCAGGSGDGPRYANGPIRVSGSDPYDLGSEGDGVACE